MGITNPYEWSYWFLGPPFLMIFLLLKGAHLLSFQAFVFGGCYLEGQVTPSFR